MDEGRAHDPGAAGAADPGPARTHDTKDLKHTATPDLTARGRVRSVVRVAQPLPTPPVFVTVMTNLASAAALLPAAGS